MHSKLYVTKPAERLKKIAVVLMAAALFAAAANMLELDISKFIGRLSNAGKVLRRLAALNLSGIPDILSGMLVSVSIAVAALAAGCVISLVLAFLAAKNIAPSRVLSAVIKGVTAVIRAVPALVWILMVVASTGFGSTGGVMGMMFPTVGYLTKSFISSIEEAGSHTIEAMRATGAGWLNIAVKGLLPGLTAPFIAWTAIRTEGNIAESINLGMVGVAGVGNMLMRAIGTYDYASTSTIILVIFFTLVIVELLVNKLKKAINTAS